MFCDWCGNDMKDGVCTVCGKNVYGQTVKPKSRVQEVEKVDLSNTFSYASKVCKCCKSPIKDGFCIKCGRHESWDVESPEDYAMKLSYHTYDYDFSDGEDLTISDETIRRTAQGASIGIKILAVTLRVLLTLTLGLFFFSFFLVLGVAVAFFQLCFGLGKVRNGLFQMALGVPSMIGNMVSFLTGF